MLVSELDSPEELRVVVAKNDFFGNVTYVLAGLPRRFYPDGLTPPPLLAEAVNARRTKPRKTAVERALTHDGPWLAATSRAQQTLLAWLLVSEDPQRRLDVSPFTPLKHQRTLVEHVLSSPELSRVLIGDEVGLGKTIEAALIAKSLRTTNPATRILYLAPARLVSNVVHEWGHLGLDARRFTATDADARPATDLIVAASIHRAVLAGNRGKLLAVPWDVIIVDECHHLSDYGSSKTQSFRLVEELVAKQAISGRLILMSGTPHQGNPERFRNLLGLLKRQGEDEAALAGRVIFRLKEQVTDWDGRPLFPLREVRSPTVVSLDEMWRAFYDDVAALYDHSIAGSRAAGWAKCQALEWVASSMKAGVAYLARMAMRRLGWTLDYPALVKALQALVPYVRGGQVAMTAAEVFSVFVTMTRPPASDDPEDDIDDDLDEWQPDSVRLADLLERGAALIQGTADDAKWEAMCRIIEKAGNEKIVLFCQPIETVSAVADILEVRFGEKAAIIVGGQSDEDRKREVDRFLRPDGARFLVSSRAGGEGINLQVARRLIHVDIPWNPMDMEQRVGRVHRFGSRQRILVDTLVVAGTREERAYEMAREKLRIITSQLTLSPADREILFSRVMSLVAPDELQAVMNDLAPAVDDDNPIGQLVVRGYERWQEFNRTYSGGAARMPVADGGTASWGDISSLLTLTADAKPGEVAAGTVFRMQHGDAVAETMARDTLSVFGRTWVCDIAEGLPVQNAAGQNLPRLGLNTTEVAEILLRLVRNGPVAGSIRLPSRDAVPALLSGVTNRDGCAVLVFACQGFQRVAAETREERLRLQVVVVGPDGHAHEAGDEALPILRACILAPRAERPVDPPINLAQHEAEACHRLSEASVSDEATRFAAIWPIGCFLVAPAA